MAKVICTPLTEETTFDNQSIITEARTMLVNSDDELIRRVEPTVDIYDSKLSIDTWRNGNAVIPITKFDGLGMDAAEIVRTVTKLMNELRTNNRLVFKEDYADFLKCYNSYFFQN